jgi:small GTP-binding protein
MEQDKLPIIYHELENPDNLEIDLKSPLKIILIGDMNVGKTNLLLRYVNDSFTTKSGYSIGKNYIEKDVYMRGRWVKFQLWDTQGAEAREGMPDEFWAAADVVLIVYSLKKGQSFSNVPSWIEIAKANCPSALKFLIGNQKDLPAESWAVSRKEACKLAKDNQMGFELTSAKTGEGIDVIFMHTVNEMLKTNTVCSW